MGLCCTAEDVQVARAEVIQDTATLAKHGEGGWREGGGGWRGVTAFPGQVGSHMDALTVMGLRHLRG